MKTQIGIVRGASKKDVLNKNFNLYMGISLNNKWFTKENMKEYILWGLKHTKERFGIVVADTLQVTNYVVRGNYSKQAAIRKSLKDGDKFIKVISSILAELSQREVDRIDIIRWEDVKKDSSYKKSFEIFQNKFHNDMRFKNEIINVVEDFIKKLKFSSFNKDKIEGLCNYVLEELPELTNGFTFNKTYYNCFIYPSDALLLELIEQIQNKEKFSELSNVTEIKRNSFVELKVLN